MPHQTPITDDRPHDALERDLTDQIKFQRKWHTLSMLAYAVTTTGMLVCSATATLMAARGWAQAAAATSATATVMIGIEKSFLFREKWKFHLAMHTKLTLLKAHLDWGSWSIEEASKEFSQIMSSYAAELPMAPRENG